MTFDQVWEYADKIPGSYTKLNGQKLFKYASQTEGPIVEIGVDQGRSSSLLLHISQEHGTDLWLIDSWESCLVDNFHKVIKMIAKDFNHDGWREKRVRKVVHAKAADMAGKFDDDSIGLLHIDANHYEGGIDVDCKLWLPKLQRRGIVCFHDYGATFDAVTKAVDHFTKGWGDLGLWDGLAIRKKP